MRRIEGYLEEYSPLNARLFAIAIRKLANSLSYGIDRSPFLGSGTEYVQSRPYEAGDPVKSIDWRVTARTGKPYVKEYEAPKCVPCVLLIDTSASMAIASTRRSKYELALMVAGGIAFACLDRASPVGVVAAGERALRIAPSLSRARVMEWLLQLRRHHYDEATKLAARTAELGPLLKQRALIVVLSDLHDPDCLPALKQLAQLHDLIVLQFSDPAETGLRGAGLLRAREVETGREFVTHGRARWTDPERTARELKHAGLDHLRLVTDRAIEAPLRNLFRARGILGRGMR
jgi:uncharacterized protein (DUF58 family)